MLRYRISVGRYGVKMCKLTWLALAADQAARFRFLEPMHCTLQIVKGKEVTLSSSTAKFLSAAARVRAVANGAKSHLHYLAIKIFALRSKKAVRSRTDCADYLCAPLIAQARCPFAEHGD